MAKNPPESMQHHLRHRLTEYARTRWPQVSSIDVRFRAGFAYVAAQLTGEDDPQPLCRLRFCGALHTWGFALYLASSNKYEPTFLPTGLPVGSPEDCLNCAGTLHFDDYYPTRAVRDATPSANGELGRALSEEEPRR